MRALRVVTLPPAVTGAQALEFARVAVRSGADLLEVRTDLHAPGELEVSELATVAKVLVARRKSEALPPAWVRAAALIDEPLESGQPSSLVSLHAAHTLTTADALGAWSSAQVGPQTLIKHVEPLGSPEGASRLFATQRALTERFGAGRVTVLATGPCALPFRCALSERNALDYVALDATWQAAPGQRLLADAVRSARGEGTREALNARLGIIGARIAHSRSPRTHPQPFDRIELADDTDIEPLLRAMLPYYRGLAITAPFKRAAARAAASPLPAINTLVRRGDRWDSANTDVDGARAVLDALGAGSTEPVIVLGDGGATDALRAAAARAIQVVSRASLLQRRATEPLASHAVWTWPSHVEAPPGLRFAPGTKVAVIAYGPPARVIAARIRDAGGVPVMHGPRWFVAQARAQRQLWSTAT